MARKHEHEVLRFRHTFSACSYALIRSDLLQLTFLKKLATDIVN